MLAGPTSSACARLQGLPAPAAMIQLSQRCNRHAAAPLQPARGAVRAAAKRSGGGAGGSRNQARKSQIDEVAQFEQLMEDWDDAFAADCADTEKAVVMARLAEEGHRQHGRGFVFVRSQLERRSRKSTKGGFGGSKAAAKGFGAVQSTAAEGTPLPNNPQLRLLSWTAAFIPGSVLDGGVGGVFTPADGGALLPDSSSLLAGNEAASAGEAGAEAVAELQRVMRGQDPSQLRALVGLPPLHAAGPAAGDAGEGSSEQQAVDAAADPMAPDSSDQTQMGVRQYEPEAGELVVLLSARISGAPALGAELLVVARQADGSTTLELPDGWEQALAMA